MTVQKFLAEFIPGEETTDETLEELSGISNGEATELASSWSGWEVQHVLDLQTRLVDMSAIDASAEFECIFKAGLRHSDPRVRAASSHGLTESGDTSAVSMIVDLLRRDTDKEVRIAAAISLSNFATLASEGHLSARVREAVSNVLMEILDDPVADPELWRRSLEAAGAFDERRVDVHIQRALGSDRANFKSSAMIAIARTSNPRWLDDAVESVENGDESVRFEAVNAIGEIGEEGDVMYLEEPLDDQDLMVQMAAVAAVEKLGGPAAKRLLQIARQSPEPAVSNAADEALKGIEGEENLIHPVTPELAKQGMFGATVGSMGDDEVPYDAGEREGWGGLTEEGESFISPDAIHEDDDDPLASLMDYEATPGQYEDDD